MLVVPVLLVFLGGALVPMVDRFAELVRVERPLASATTASPETHGPALRVKVLDADGSPVSGASVRLVGAAPAFEVVGESRTDAKGASSFTTARLEGVRVIASHETLGVVSSREVTLSSVEPAETTELELVLSTREAIQCTVVDGADHPVAGAVVSVTGMPWATAPGTATDADGSVRLVTVPHEARSLAIVARGFRTASASLLDRSRTATPTELPVRVKLVPGPEVEGEVSDVDGNPVRASVVACEGEAAETQVSAGADGKFVLPPSAIGCSVVATSDGLAASTPVVATEGQRLALRLRQGGGIEGVVVDERGASVSPFVLGIEAFAAARGKSRARGGQRTFDEGGAFHLDKLAPGTYVLTASSSGKPPTRSAPVEVTSGSVTKGVRIVLVRGGVVKGHVYDEQHAPVAGVDLAFDAVSSAVPSNVRATSDEGGAYVLDGAPDGPFTVRAEKKGYRARMLTGLTAASGATLPLDITLTASDGKGDLEFAGIGASLQPGAGGIVFREVFPGDPADRAGLHGGDVITRIDGESTENMSLADALQRLRGQAGTTVGITVTRAGEGSGAPKQTIDAVVVRAIVVR
jgi:hypothetical protein